VIGFDAAGVLALARARGLDERAVATFLPAIEAGLIEGLKDQALDESEDADGGGAVGG